MQLLYLSAIKVDHKITIMKLIIYKLIKHLKQSILSTIATIYEDGKEQFGSNDINQYNCILSTMIKYNVDSYCINLTGIICHF